MSLNRGSWCPSEKEKRTQVKWLETVAASSDIMGKPLCWVTLSSRSQFLQQQRRGLISISGYQTFILNTLSQITGLARWVAARGIHLYEVLKQQWKQNKMEKTAFIKTPLRKRTICDPRVSCLGYWVRFPRSKLKKQQMEDKPFFGEGLWFTTRLLCS